MWSSSRCGITIGPSINQHDRGDGDSIPFRFSDTTHIRDGAETTEQTSLFRRRNRVRAE